MLEQVENKILELKKTQAEEYYKRKDADLQAWGLTYKTDGNKVTPIIVTDEEYEALIKASNGVDRVGRNPFAKALNVLTYVSAGAGAVSGAVVAALSDELAFVYFTLCLVAGLVVGVIFKGMSEIIRLLQQIIDSKPNEKPEDIALAAEQAKAQQKKSAQPKAQPQPQVQAQPQPAVYQPVFTTYPGGPAVYSQQPPVYIYQQPVQPQAPQQQAPQTGFRYGEQK
ncbi:MAG: hypothetical protein IJN88_00640 [Clostridia bacterium]|nr:hypothetical protein [Clostridia bacterium]